MEKVRLTLDPNLSGAEFNKFVEDWADKYLDARRGRRPSATCATESGDARTPFLRGLRQAVDGVQEAFPQ